MTEQSQSTNGLSRRQFLKTSAAASAALGAQFSGVAYAQGLDKLRIGLIGCGGRGTSAVINNLEGNDNVELVAMGDVFRDRLENSRNRLNNQDKIKDKIKVTDDTCFDGFDAYQKVLDSDVDMVILASTPHFRPRHFEAAIKAGKHVFMEKPVCVDPVGARRVIQAGKMADEKGLSVVAGTQRRHQSSYLEVIKRIQDGEIGQIKGGEAFWNGGELWHHGDESGWSQMEHQIRNWYYYTWLCGDHVVEQHVHNLDVLNWIMGGPPQRVAANGGRHVRRGEKWGEIFDHFAADLDYGNGRHALSMCRQHDNTSRRVAEHVVGTKGHANPGQWLEVNGERKEFATKRNPYVQEHIDLVNAIRSGDHLNEAERVAESTLTAVMVRMSAYTGRDVSFEWALNASELDLSPEKYEWGPAPEPQVAIPGETELV
jgi:predicted dehydrogenase